MQPEETSARRNAPVNGFDHDPPPIEYAVAEPPGEPLHRTRRPTVGGGFRGDPAQGKALPMTRPGSSSAQFGMDFDYDVGRTLISLHGELDALSVPPFAGVLTALAEHGVRSVTIDLSALRFCNVGGLRAMAELAARLNESDGRVEIVAPGILTRLLDIAELRALFVVDTSNGPDGLIDLETSRGQASRSRPRAGSLERLATGT
jgi:anti-anti-sigma factor